MKTVLVIGWLSMVIAAQPDKLLLELQGILDGITSQQGTGTGISFGAVLPDSHSLLSGARANDGVISLAAGHRYNLSYNGTMHTGACVAPKQKYDPSCVYPADAFAMGSTAKMYTAAAVLRLVDQGKFDLDDIALPLFDVLWTKLNGSSIVNAMGPLIHDVTVRQLLGMTAGIPDFDNDASRQYQFDHPNEDLGPVKEMSFILPLGQFSCKPGACADYSSSNYELLGVLLAQQAGKDSWDEYTQAEDLPAFPEMTSTAFAVHGPCSKYTKVHAYSNERKPQVDVYDISCTNGWTCGNLISNAADAAFFVRALLGKGERVVKEKTQKEMLKTRPFEHWAKGLPYGLGVMDVGVFFREFFAQRHMEPGELMGHAGETYGFNAFTVYSKKWDFGLSVIVNNEQVGTTMTAIAAAYEAIVQYLSGGSTSTYIV
jgi:CubicO group peptidase (beta-lactamase class C family)